MRLLIILCMLQCQSSPGKKFCLFCSLLQPCYLELWPGFDKYSFSEWFNELQTGEKKTRTRTHTHTHTHTHTQNAHFQSLIYLAKDAKLWQKSCWGAIIPWDKQKERRATWGILDLERPVHVEDLKLTSAFHLKDGWMEVLGCPTSKLSFSD